MKGHVVLCRQLFEAQIIGAGFTPVKRKFSLDTCVWRKNL